MSSLAFLFVYGTLRRGFTNPAAQRLWEQAEWLGETTAPGSLYQVTDWYPGFVPNENEPTVHGDLLQVPATVFAFLDDYEGDEYERQLITLSDQRKAWTYVWLGPTPPAQRIPSGRFTPQEKDFPAPTTTADPTGA